MCIRGGTVGPKSGPKRWDGKENAPGLGRRRRAGVPPALLHTVARACKRGAAARRLRAEKRRLPTDGAGASNPTYPLSLRRPRLRLVGAAGLDQALAGGVAGHGDVRGRVVLLAHRGAPL